MDLRTFLEKNYQGIAEYELWKKAFPKMYEFAEQVEVIPWQEEFALEDKNPEIIDRINFYQELLKNGMITEKEYMKRMGEINTFARKTLGIAFVEERKVAFRERVPSLQVALHELGHIFFEKRDDVWSDKYAGGETLMWAIATGRIEGEQGRNEELVENYIDIFEFVQYSPEEGMEILEHIAQEIVMDMGVDNPKEYLEKYGMQHIKPTWLNVLLFLNGTLPSSDYTPANYIQNLMVGALYRQPIPQRFIGTLTTNSLEEWKEKVFRKKKSKRRKLS